MNAASFHDQARRLLLIGLLASLPAWPLPAQPAATNEATPTPTRVLHDGGRYFGPLEAGLLHGNGRIEWDGGSQYQGEFSHGRMQGRGRMTYPNGMVIEGTFDGYQTVGPGIIVSPQGVRYVGELQGQMPHGKGAITLADKSVVSGDFREGELAGPGQIRWADGAVYTGGIQRNRAQGRGELRYANGDVYRGQFVAGKPDGKGRLVQVASGGTAAKPRNGHWRNGVYIGPDGDGTVDDAPGLAARNNEAVLYNQQELLGRQWNALKPSGSGSAEMYALFVAGDGSQEVFRREVSFVDDLFARRFGTRGRSVSLVNSRSSTARLPLATAHSIELSLQALARNMNRERDLLFVFLSSHGSRNHELSLGMNGMALPDLPAARLGALLKASGIRNQVIVVSACYSGGFIPALQGERTWVITAARADRSSFGCADENDFTYFGRALFKESLPNASSLSAAVGHAIKKVEEWEARDMAPAEPAGTLSDEADAAAHSEPQSVVAPAFRAEVDDWFAAHGPARPH